MPGDRVSEQVEVDPLRNPHPDHVTPRPRPATSAICRFNYKPDKWDSYKVAPGDKIYVHVGIKKNGKAFWRIVNKTRKYDTGTATKPFKGSSPDGTAEWILERPALPAH